MRSGNGSKYKIDNDEFKLFIGTINKKMPETIYIEGGTYISSVDQEKKYTEKINIIQKNFAKEVSKISKETLIPHTTVPIFNGKSIVNFEIPETRITDNKRVLLSFGCYFKQAKNNLLDFKTISQYTTPAAKELVGILSGLLTEYGFSYKKTRN